MDYISISEAAKKWQLTEQTVRRFCREGRIANVTQNGRAWLIPKEADKPGKVQEKKKPTIVTPKFVRKVQRQKKKRSYHGLYDYIQVQLTYSSCRMASNRLTRKQINSIFKTGKAKESFEPVKVSDFIEVLNHIACVDYIIDHAMEPISQKFIKKLHEMLMSGTVDSRNDLVVPGIYRPAEYQRPDRNLSPASTIPQSMTEIIKEYEALDEVEISDILNFHVEFEMISPFKDGNGRIGRLIMFKECMRHAITPFIFDDKHRADYLTGIKKWTSRRKLFIQAVESAQEYFQNKIDFYELDEHGQQFLPEGYSNE